MNVDDLVERVVGTYGTARLYSDRGTRVFETNDGDWTVDFETAFERPDRLSFSFRFAGRPTSGRGELFEYARRLQAEGGRVRMGDPEWQPGWAQSLPVAVAALTGVSYNTAHDVPRLLLPEIDGRGLFESWDGRTLAADELIDGERHHAIELRGGGRVVRVLVSATTNVIRRIQESRDTQGRRITARSDYRAVLTP